MMDSRRRVFIAVYAGSGAAALIYQVAWTRMLTLQLGHTVAASSTVLAAFMGGLALGAWLAGRPGAPASSIHAHRQRLRLYGLLELAVAAAALLLPLALAAAVPLLRWAYEDGGAPTRFELVRIALCLSLVSVPAAAMGATFPIAASWFADRSAHGSASAADAGILYAANSAGAALGAIAAGFFLIPALGLRGTTWVGMSLNLLAAGGAYWLAAGVGVAEASSAEEARSAAEPRRAKKSRHSFPALAWTATAISGFAALVYEVAWTRVLALVLGPTTFAFATMVAAFISGIAIGSAAGARLARRTSRPVYWLALMLMIGGVATTSAAWFAAVRLPLMVAAAVAAPGAAFGPIVFWQALGIGLLLLPTTMALGAAFSLALAVASGGADSPIQRDVAQVYAANTVGAITGALAGGFLLVPQLGLRATLHTAAILAAAGGAVCLTVAMRRAGPRGIRGAVGGLSLGAAAVAAILLLPEWDRHLLASGAYKYASYLASGDLELVRAGTLEYYKEGAAGTVTVKDLAGTRSLAIDGKVDASNGADMLTQRLLGLLPALLHPDPQELCVIGLGSSVTLGSALTTGTFRRADVVEISPEVVEASALFDRESGRPLQTPGVRLIVGDGRSHLLLTRRRYDVIVSEPSNPWMAGVATLFTREFFEAARARLKPDGLLCQWAHTYDIRRDDLRSIVRTFSSVFPVGTMWLVGESDLLLIGTNGDSILPRLEQLSATWRRGTASSALAQVGITGESTPFALLSLFVSGPRGLDEYGGNAPIQTDDRTALEFSAPRGIYGRPESDNVDEIRKLAVESVPAVRAAIDRATSTDWIVRGNMLLAAEANESAYDAFRRAVAMNPRSSEALRGMGDSAGRIGKLQEVRASFREIAMADPSNVPARIELSQLLTSTRNFEAAAALADEAVRIAPNDPVALEQLAAVFADAGDGERLLPLAESLIARFPSRPDARYYKASALFLSGRMDEAAAEAKQLVAEHPDHARGFNLLGAACGTQGQWGCARAALESSIRINPGDAASHVNLGLVLLRSGSPEEAANQFAEALTIDPGSDAARDGLAQTRSSLIKP